MASLRVRVLRSDQVRKMKTEASMVAVGTISCGSMHSCSLLQGTRTTPAGLAALNDGDSDMMTCPGVVSLLAFGVIGSAIELSGVVPSDMVGLGLSEWDQ